MPDGRKNFEADKEYVLTRREELGEAWESKRSRPATKATSA